MWNFKKIGLIALLPFSLVILTMGSCAEEDSLHLQKLSGDNQIGEVHQPLPNLLKARVVDQNGVGVSGVEVSFLGSDGAEKTEASGEDGVVETVWTLGPTPGTQTISATVTANGGSSAVDFTATAKRRSCIEESFSFPPSPVTFIPPHTNGDQEYNGHGPLVTVTAFIYRDGTRLMLRLYMKAIETTQDWTTAEGYEVFDITPAGLPVDREIINIVGATNYSMTPFTDTDHQIDVINAPSGSLVLKCEIIGDSSGNDAGINTRVTVYFNPITLLLRELSQDCE